MHFFWLVFQLLADIENFLREEHVMQDLLIQIQFVFEFLSLTFFLFPFSSFFFCQLSIVICGSGAFFLSLHFFSAFSLLLSRPFSHSLFVYYSLSIYFYFTREEFPFYIVLSSIISFSVFIGYMLVKILIDSRELSLSCFRLVLSYNLLNKCKVT